MKRLTTCNFSLQTLSNSDAIRDGVNVGDEFRRADFGDKFSLDITSQPNLALYARDCAALKASARSWKSCVGLQKV